MAATICDHSPLFATISAAGATNVALGERLVAPVLTDVTHPPTGKLP